MTTMHHVLASSLLAAASVLGSGCAGSEQTICTQIGCGSALEIEFFKQSPWAPGTYVVTVTADGASTECEVELPLQCDAPPACGQDAGVTLALDGCALPPEEQSIAGVEWYRDAPAHVSVSVSRDGEGLGDASFDATYETHRPNGPQCEPECTQAQGTMVMKLQ